MKGQISIDYIIAIVIFIFFVIYFLFEITNIVPKFIGQIEEQEIRSKAYQISEILINDPGYPENWNFFKLDSEYIQRIGLSNIQATKTNYFLNERNYLSLNKINRLMELCDTTLGGIGYEKVTEKIGTNLDFSIIITDKLNNEILLNNCHPKNIDTTIGRPIVSSFVVSIDRIVTFDNGNYGELKLQVWQ